MDKFSKKTLGDLYNLKPELYEYEPVEGVGFSGRLVNCLHRHDIKTIAELLMVSPFELSGYKNLGTKSFLELDDYLNNEREISSSKKDELFTSKEIGMLREALYENDMNELMSQFLNDKKKEFIHKCKDARNNIEYELFVKAIEADDYIFCLIDTFNEFHVKTQGEKQLDVIRSRIPYCRRKKPFFDIYKIYLSEKKREVKCPDDSNITLDDYLSSIMCDYLASDIDIVKFLDWCSYDLCEMIGDFISEEVNDRSRDIIIYRAKGYSLDNVGKIYNVTRERIRQIESKVIKKFDYWIRKNRLVDKILVDCDRECFLTEEDIIALVGNYGQVICYLLRACRSNIYNKEYNVFFINKEVLGSIENTIEKLPEVVNLSQMEEVVDNIKNEYGNIETLVYKVIDSYYNKTGIVYHKCRLTRSMMCSEILKKYYREGIHITDDVEMSGFRQYLKNEFGIELDSSNRALGAIIAREGILCNRGVYKYNTQNFISEELANKILLYIRNNNSPALLMNTVYNEFEHELLLEGVNNKYFLQGILHDLFEDELYFRRDYVSKDNSFISLYTQIGEYIKKHVYPVSKGEIYEAFPGVTEIIINLAVSDERIINLFGKYIHGDNIALSDSDIKYYKESVVDILEKRISVHCKEIFYYLERNNPTIMSNNYIDQPFCLFSLLEFLFRNEFEFDRPYIAKKGSKIQKNKDTVYDYVKELDVVNMTEIMSFARDIHYVIYSQLEFADSCNETHFLVSKDSLVSIELLGVDESMIKSIESIIDEENINTTIPISSIGCLHLLPKINYKWTDWLLYSVLKRWSLKYDVGVSNHKLKKAEPLISPKGKLDLKAFSNTDLDRSIILKDDLDNIDDLIKDVIIEDVGGAL